MAKTYTKTRVKATEVMLLISKADRNFGEGQDEEQHIVGRQPLERQDLRREEVHPHQNVPV